MQNTNIFSLRHRHFKKFIFGIVNITQFVLLSSMKKLLILSFSLITFLPLLAQQEKNKTVLNIKDRIQMTVPNAFLEPTKLANDSTHMVLKHKNELVMLIYELALPGQPSAVDIEDNDIPQWTDKHLSVIRKSSVVTYLDDGIFLQDGKNIGYIKYKTDHKDSFNTFNLLFFMSIDGKLFQGHFSSPYKHRKKWEPVADEIANSLRIIPQNNAE